MLKDLRAKILRAKGKHLICGRILGGVKKYKKKYYQYVIQGQFAAKGPLRKTKTEAQRDGKAIALAKDREAAQKMLKDLEAKSLRAKGEHLLYGRSLGGVCLLYTSPSPRDRG